jgi:hypothetical protein
MSVAAVRRARKVLVAAGKFMRLNATSNGVTNTYWLNETMNWGVSGRKLWLPKALWDLELDPKELRLYCHYLCAAQNSQYATIDRNLAHERCHMTAPTQRKVEMRLVSAGLLAYAGRDDKKPVFALLQSSAWVERANRETQTEAKGKLRAGYEVREQENPEQGRTAKENSEQGKRKLRAPRVIELIKTFLIVAVPQKSFSKSW